MPKGERKYYPFGHEVDGSDGDTRLRFTGHERDDRIGMDYMLARYYSPAMARFLGVDPVVGEVASGQSWNRFGYVHSNPLSHVDPTGMVPEQELGKPLEDLVDAASDFIAGVFGVLPWPSAQRPAHSDNPTPPHSPSSYEPPSPGAAGEAFGVIASTATPYLEIAGTVDTRIGPAATLGIQFIDGDINFISGLGTEYGLLWGSVAVEFGYAWGYEPNTPSTALETSFVSPVSLVGAVSVPTSTSLPASWARRGGSIGVMLETDVSAGSALIQSFPWITVEDE